MDNFTQGKLLVAKTCIQDSFCASKLLFALLLVMSGASAANAQYSAIDLRGNTLCAITTNGEAACSDRGPQWALPDDLPSVREIAAGQNSACAITENDNLSCWGPDGFGVTWCALSFGEYQFGPCVRHKQRQRNRVLGSFVQRSVKCTSGRLSASVRCSTPSVCFGCEWWCGVLGIKRIW